MKVVSFTVKKYRSIVEANKIVLKDYNVLLGKNNEGKSNILRALSVCIYCINDYRRFRFNFPRRSLMYRDWRFHNIYSWDRDFPVDLKMKSRDKKSTFELELLLDEEELKNFNNSLKTGIRKRNILMRIEIGDDNRPVVTFPLRGTSSLTRKRREVLEFLSDKITYNYIPAIRTEEDALRLIKNNIATELEGLNQNEDYIESLDHIRQMQGACLDIISQEIGDELKEFLPKVKEVKIEIEDDYGIATSVRDINVYVDDGALTNIENKGDGIKSLAVLAILKNRQSMFGSSSIVAIDEPEAHLHPGAINELVNTLKEISKNSQVIISTHNQLFTNYNDLNGNIIIDNRKVKLAESIAEIRNVLGVKASDNLINARFVLLVEGKTDEKILDFLLKNLDENIGKLLSERELMVYGVGGAAKLEYNANKFKKEMCICMALVDNDEAGKAAYERVIKNKDIENPNIFMCNCKGMRSSELEDLINPKVYEEKFLEEFGVDLNDKNFKNRNKKWSERVKDTFRSQGKLINDDVLVKAKQAVMESILSQPNAEECLLVEKSEVISVLIHRIKELVKNS